LLSVPWLSAEALLRVLVVDQDGKPLEKAEVSVGTFNDKKGKTEKTNRDGIAQFKKLEDGYYRVWARAEKFKPGLFEFLRISGESEKQVKLALEPGFSGMDLYFESPGVLAKSKQLAREGLNLMNSQMYAEAERKLQEALSLCPSDPTIHQNLSLLYANLGKWELAEKSLADASDLLQILSLIGDLESAEVSTQEAELERLRREIAMRRLSDEANRALNEEDFEQAIAKFRQLTELEPDKGDHYYYLASALARDGKTDEAILAIEKASELEPDEERYRRFKLSVLEVGKKQTGEEAEAIIEETQKLLDAHDYDGALARSREAMGELADEYQGMLSMQVARAYAGLEQPEDAVAAYQKSTELAPGNVEFRRELTEYLIEHERYEEAFASLEKLSEMTSTAFEQSLLELAKELMQKGRSGPARVAFERVLEVNPECAEAYYELGVEYYYGGEDKERAKAMLNKYLEMGKDPELLDNARTLLKVLK